MALGIELELAHQPVLPETHPVTLVSRRDYGAEVQAPTAILRFALPQVPPWRRVMGHGFGRFQAGDLLGILAEGSAVPRFYSLASGKDDNFIEIVVRKQSGGLCSGQLVALGPGDMIPAFLRLNPGSHAGHDHTPLILIGAGTGIGPLAGFVRGNESRRLIHLFFGMRHPDSDFLYGEDLQGWQAEGHLTRVVTAISREAKPRYVQDVLRDEAVQVAGLLGDGARVTVCGGRNMAAGVADALADILALVGAVLHRKRLRSRADSGGTSSSGPRGGRPDVHLETRERSDAPERGSCQRMADGAHAIGKGPATRT